ncbi:hypothetical protein OSTOST_23703 [Ostertagia ostertagi]
MIDVFAVNLRGIFVRHSFQVLFGRRIPRRAVVGNRVSAIAVPLLFACHREYSMLPAKKQPKVRLLAFYLGFDVDADKTTHHFLYSCSEESVLSVR